MQTSPGDAERYGQHRGHRHDQRECDRQLRQRGQSAEHPGVTVNGLPTITVPGAQVEGVGKALGISGISIAETGNTAAETFTAVASDTNGVLSATGGTQSNGNHTVTITGSLATVNADLATLSDTDSTAGTDTITVNATDSFGNTAAQQTIGVTVNAAPVLHVPGAQTLSVGVASAIEVACR